MFYFINDFVHSVLVVFLFLGVPGICTAAIFNEDTGHYYEIVSSGESGAWINAEYNARALGGNLVTINNKKEEEWLRSTFGSDKYWIGFTDVRTEGTWEWSSGEGVTYENWAAGEPNNLPSSGALDFGEDFAVLNWNSTTGGWNDWTILRPDRETIGRFDGIAEFPVPIPAAFLLFGSALVGLLGVKGRRRV